MNNKQKILCNECVHRNVCTYKYDYLLVLDSIFNKVIELPCSDNGEISYKNIKDFNFITDIKIECKYFSVIKRQIKGGNLDNE